MKECPLCGRLTTDAADRCASDGETLHPLFEGPPIIAGRYLLQRRLGRGGMGLVCLAEHLVLKRTCAIKLILPERVHDPVALARFRTEAEALGRLEHPNVVQVIDYGIDERAGGIPYLVMEHLQGTSLRQLLREGGALPMDRALPVFDQIAEALDFAHDRGILHRDLKPENVILADGPRLEQEVKLLDLGLARFFDPVEAQATPEGDHSRPPEPAAIADPEQTGGGGVTSEGMVVGTMAYIAPEAARGALPSPAGDIYAFGVLVYETLTGQRPLGFDELRRRALGESLEPPPPSALCEALPEALDEVLSRPLARDPGLRPSSGTELVKAIRRSEHRARLEAWRRRERPRRAVLALAVAVMALVVAPLLAPLPALRRLENRLLDARFSLSRPRDPDPRILLVSIDDASLATDPTPLIELGDEVARRLARVLEAGALGAAIDIVLPVQWGALPEFATVVIERADRLVLAAGSTEDEVIGTEVARGLISVALGEERAGELFAFVNLLEDADGKVRRLRTEYRTVDGTTHPTFAARVATVLAGHPPGPPAVRLIDHRIDWRRIERLSWKDLAAELEGRPQRYRGRLVILGVEFSGSGDIPHHVPHPRGMPPSVSGLALQGVMVSTLVGERAPRPLPRGSIMVTSALIALAIGGMLLWNPRILPAAFAILGIGVVLAVISMALFGFRDCSVPMTEGTLVMAVSAAAAALLRWRLPGRPRPL